MVQSGEGKTIARNTLYLYTRMLITLGVSLYTSRVILQVLGIDDNGLYQTVGGIVGFLSFLNGALSTATSRFITFALGKGDDQELRKTFSITVTAHLIIGLVIVLLAETVGLWYVYNKMVIPPDRFDAAVIVFHLSILASFLSILQVPFSAEIIAHERMSVFAYIGIFEACAKLGSVYLLNIGQMDKMVLYAILILLVSICLFSFNTLYCRRHFSEVSFRMSLDRQLFGKIFSFSGWSLMTNCAIALSNQGITLLLNLFFPPSVVTARGVASQVNNAASQFVGNFRTAVNPRIVKQFAAEDYVSSKRLMLVSAEFSYYLMFLFALPIFFLAEPLLDLWLVEVPKYAATFLQIIIIQSLFTVFNLSFFTAISAAGRIRENAWITTVVLFACFPIVYVLFKQGASPTVLSWAYLVAEAFLAVVAKPYLLVKIVDYKWGEILQVFWKCFKVTLLAVPVPLVLYLRVGVSNLVNCSVILVIAILSVLVSVWVLGLTGDMRALVIQTVKSRLAKS